MNFPYIYSVSTVGMRRHYNQDYLIHPERTDFTGSNGVGKSILADILQLMFIYDDKLIEFGTDGLKKELRTPYSLPLKANEAYAFLNIRVTEESFITIGVSIPNKKGRRIKPFIIMNDPDMNKSLEDLTFSSDRLLYSNHFIKNGNFMSIEELSQHFRDDHSLYLKHFTYKEEKDEYYSFLFNKDILSINLTIESNLNAFAKIIQSFSKAKSLTIGSNKSLQDFLFENDKDDLSESFITHKSNLEQLLADYKKLEDYVRELEHKQISLSALKSIEERKKPLLDDYLKTNFLYCYAQSKKATQEHEDYNKQLEIDLKEHQKLTNRNIKLQKVSKRAQSEVEITEGIIKNLDTYQIQHNELNSIEKEIKSIESANIPELEDVIETNINIELFTTVEILRRISEFNFLHKEYGSLTSMKNKVKEQKDIIDNHKLILNSSIQEIKGLLDLITLNKKDSLFSKVLEKGEKISDAQEAILFHLVNVYWNKPSIVKNTDHYTSSLNILNESNITFDDQNNGYWLKTGDLNTFISKDSKKQLFNDPTKLKRAIDSRKKELEIEIKEKNAKLDEIEKFEKGVVFANDKLGLNYLLDQRLKDYTAYQQHEETAKIAQNIKHRIDSLAKNRSEINEKLNDLKNVIPINFNHKHIEVVKEKFNIIKAIKQTRATNLSNQIIEDNTDIKNLLKNIPDKTKRVEELKIKVKETTQKFEDNKLLVRENIGNILIDDFTAFKIAENEVKDKESEYSKIKEDYVTEYKSILERFNETKNKHNPETNEQTENKTYSFYIIEKVLLGPKIKHVDSITEELRDANRSRLAMAETIHETMLKIFTQTKKKYEDYRSIIRDLNIFFKGKKISNQYYFQITFNAQKEFPIDWIDNLQNQSQAIYKSGELPMGLSIEQFIENFFKKATKYNKKINFSDLLDPKTYFLLEAVLTDENKNEIPGSTGETYAAIVLLGIGRLSKVQSDNKKGIKFIILEETANLDKTNFNTFPNIAAEFGYQIITMTPKPYGSDSERGWYLHHLIKSKNDADINYPVPSSYFKTNESKKDLYNYLKTINKQ